MAITAFRHKGLERFFTTGSKAGIQAKHAGEKIVVDGLQKVHEGSVVQPMTATQLAQAASQPAAPQHAKEH